MFMGEYNNKIDAKGRLIIPAKFREDLGEEFVITRGLDKCLVVYTMEEWKRIENKFRDLPSSSKEARKFVRYFFAPAAVCELDKQGRILVPPNLREFSGLQKDVVLAGVMDKIEIWDKENWLNANDFEDDEIDEVSDSIAALGLGI